MTWHHPALAPRTINALDDDIAKLRAENARLLTIIKEATSRLLEICDGSNWPEYAQSGDGYKAYGEITETLHEIAADLQNVNG